MAHDDRYGDYDRDRGRDRWQGQGGRDDDRGFFERAGEAVNSWLGGDDDRQGYGRARSDRSPGAHADYYRGGDRGQRRTGPEGGFEHREDYRRTERYAEQGRAGWGGEGYGGHRGDEGSHVGGGRYGAGTTNPDALFGGVGAAPEFSGGPRFDRQDVGSTGTHGVHPVSSRFGEAQRDPMGVAGGGGSSARSRAILQQSEQHGGRGRIEPGGQQRSRYEHDPHYHEWRSRQIESLDRDYDEYRRENASRFESEFGAWREKRGQQRQALGRAREHMEVVGSDGQHVGTVDKVAGDRIILTKSDPNADGHHHSIPCSWIESVDDKVTISKTAEQAMQAWRDEETSRALFEKPDSGSEGPHVLERSFSGTYRDGER